MPKNSSQKILDTLQRLEQGMEKGLSDVRREMGKEISDVRKDIEKGFSEVREEMQGGFAITNQRIDQSEVSIKHLIESVVELHESLDKRVEKLEDKLSTSGTH